MIVDAASVATSTKEAVPEAADIAPMLARQRGAWRNTQRYK